MNNQKIYIIMTVVAILIGAASFLYLISRPVNNYSFELSEALPDVGRVEDDGYYFDSAHADELTEDNQKIFLNIPKDVQAGSYTLRVGYRSNAASTISVTSKSNPWAVKCDQIALNHLPKELPGEFNMNYGLGYLPGFINSQMFITKDVSDLDLYIVYCGFQDFYIQSVELIGNRNYVKTIWPVGILVVILAELIVLGFIKGFFKSKLGIEMLIVIGITLLSSIPLIFRMGLQLDDGLFLYGKIDGIIDGLKDGQFPVRIHPNTLKGYGYALGYFYPELLLYPIACMRAIGYSLRFCVYTAFFFTNFATIAISFICIKRVIKLKDKATWIATVCSFLYGMNTYRLLDIYSRGAVGEAIAIAVLPLVVTGLYIVIEENGSISWLTMGLLGLVNSHMLTCELVAEFAIILCGVCSKKIFRKECFIKLAVSCGITALLSAYFLIPFLHISSTDTFKVYAENAYNTSETMLSVTDIFALTTSTVGKVNNGTFFDTRYSIGTATIILGIVLFIWNLVKRRNSSFETICFSFGMISLWFSSALFPWKAVENMGGIIRTVFCMVQFPCRYLSITAVCFMFSIAVGLEKMMIASVNIGKEDSEGAGGDTTAKGSRFRAGMNNAGNVVSVVVCLIMLVQALYYFSTLKQVASFEHLIYDNSAIYKYFAVGMGEYEPVTFNGDMLDHSIEELQYICDESAIINPTGDMGNSGLTIGPLSKNGTESTILIINPTGEEQILYMPITYYDGYRVKNVASSDDRTDAVAELFETEYGSVGLRVPAGYYNGAHITYHENIIYRICELISVLTLAGLAICVTKR